MASSLSATFVAALRSVGTAATMAMAGFYLHRKNMITPEGKKSLARLSQQVTIPALFFSKIMACPQNFSPEPCPNITDNLSDVWVLALWPFFVVGCGLIVGALAAHISNTPPWQRRAVIAACAFANSTGLPITLLTVVHANFPATSELGAVDPNLFLSVYLLLYPILQWGIGGWLLAPGEEKRPIEQDYLFPTTRAGVRHVLNVPEGEHSANEKSKIIRELSLTDLRELKTRDGRSGSVTSTVQTSDESIPPIDEEMRLVEEQQTELTALAHPKHDIAPMTETLAKVLPKALQPPVVGALLGLLIASIPSLRGIFVDLHTRSDKAPLEWFFDGLYSVGQAAVPINMCILGVNLSMTMQNKQTPGTGLSNRTLAAIVVGKMMVMPAIGIASAVLLKNYLWHIPDAIDGPFYLVLMIVTITPTANNVMVMVELSGSGSKEGMARIIGWQYAFAPIVLSITVMLVVRVACLW